MTTGYTPNLALPYPEGNEKVIGGDDAIQALAEHLDAMWPDEGLVIERAESLAACGAEAGVGFPGTVSTLAGWTNGGSTVFTRTGPARLWLITAEVEISQAAAGGSLFSSAVHVRVNGAPFAGSYDRLALSSPVGDQRSYVHRITVSATLGDGHEVAVLASCTGASGALGIVGLRIEPVGPVR